MTLNLCHTIKIKHLPIFAPYDEVISILCKAGKSQLWAVSQSVLQVKPSAYLHNPCTLPSPWLQKVFLPSLFGCSAQNTQIMPNSFSWTLQAPCISMFPSFLLFPQFQGRITSICLIFCSYTVPMLLSLLPHFPSLSILDQSGKGDRKNTNYPFVKWNLVLL